MALSRKDRKTAPGSSALLLHPPYFQMISEALTSLKDHSGSSQPAIAKFLEDKYANQLPPNYKKILSVQLKNLVKSQKVVKIKNSYKLSSAETKPKKAVKKNNKGNSSTTVPKDEKAGGGKMKALSQVKTPEALKKRSGSGEARGLSKVRGSVTARRMKLLSQVNPPDALKEAKAT